MKRAGLLLAVLVPTLWVIANGCSGPAATRAGKDPATRPTSAPATAPATAEVRVTIDNFSFTPQTITVPAGAKVIWTNRDDVPHTVTSNTREFGSPALDTDGTFATRFERP